MIKAKRDRIAPISVFFILFISRIVVSLTNAQSVTTGFMATDMLISIFLAMVITLVISIPVIFCVKKHKNPLDVKWISYLYGIYFIYLAAVNVSRFSYFASTTLNPDSRSWMFSLIIVICAGYGAYLGIEGISRFSAFGFVLLSLALLSALVFNLRGFEVVNLFPVISNSVKSIASNTALISCSCSEIIIFLCISKRVNGNGVKPFYLFVVASFSAIFLLVLFVVGVMGDGAMLQAFPLYTLFQNAKIGGFERVDVLHISLWIFGIFVKAAILIYCASVCLKGISQKYSVIIASLLAFGAALLLSNMTSSAGSSIWLIVIPSGVFYLAIPILSLIFKKRNYGDELIEIL